MRRNLERVRERIGPEVEVLAAIKYVEADDLPALAEAGIELVGENRAQDLLAKQEAHGDLFTWDFIGPLQSRKVKDMAPNVRLIHSIASDSALRSSSSTRRGGADPGERGGRGGEGGIAPGELGDFIARCPVPGHRPDDDAAVHGGPGGQPPPLRPSGRAGGRARPGAPLDGHLAGLRGGGRGGRDDRGRLGSVLYDGALGGV